MLAGFLRGFFSPLEVLTGLVASPPATCSHVDRAHDERSTSDGIRAGATARYVGYAVFGWPSEVTFDKNMRPGQASFPTKDSS
jgi:hypothetical protein